MGKDVAVPDILPAKVDQVVGYRDTGYSADQRILPGVRPGPFRAASSDRSARMLSGTVKGTVAATGLRATIVSSSGLTLTVSFQPSSVGVGSTDKPVPADAVDHLHIIHMPVDRVGVNTIMGDLPDLGPVSWPMALTLHPGTSS